MSKTNQNKTTTKLRKIFIYTNKKIADCGFLIAELIKIISD
jgi:hypothetical protein